MYLGWRLPIVINVSYFYQFHDDPRRTSQCSRAASLISACMAFRDMAVTCVPFRHSLRAACG